jgi:hypothetical protein
VAFKVVERQVHRWPHLAESEKWSLLQKLANLSRAQQQRLSSDYLPVREEMAGLAASHGMDSSFLYH